MSRSDSSTCLRRGENLGHTGAAPRGARQRGADGVLELAHVPLGLAAAAVQRQYLLAAVGRCGQVGDDVEAQLGGNARRAPGSAGHGLARQDGG